MRVSLSQDVRVPGTKFPLDPSCVGVDSASVTVVGENHAGSVVKRVIRMAAPVRRRVRFVREMLKR
jgi:hypothetical protein